MKEFGNKIKALRRKMNLTQEELAERLNVSFQAVSKWETNASLPDITMFPVLANFFNVTTDELLGVDLAKKNVEINEILQEYFRLGNLGKEKEKFDFICSAYHKYPNEYKILNHYIWALYYDPYFWEDFWSKTEKGKLPPNAERVAHKKEILNLCNRILNECVDEQIRYTAIDVLSSVYRDLGNIDKANEYIMLLPEEMQHEGEELLYERGTEKWWEMVRLNIYEITENLFIKIRNCALYEKSNSESVRIFKKCEALLNLIYDDGDYGFAHYHLAELYLSIACRYAWDKNFEACAKYLDLGLYHSQKYDELPELTIHTSFLVKEHIFEASKVNSGYEGNDVKRELKYIEENECYSGVRNEKWYKDIINKYQSFARNTKK